MTVEEAFTMKLTGTVIGEVCGKDQLSRRCEEMTLIVCLFVLFLNNGTFLNLCCSSGWTRSIFIFKMNDCKIQ